MKSLLVCLVQCGLFLETQKRQWAMGALLCFEAVTGERSAFIFLSSKKYLKTWEQRMALFEIERQDSTHDVLEIRAVMGMGWNWLSYRVLYSVEDCLLECCPLGS